MRAAKHAAEAQGMRLIPSLATLSHLEPYITWVDSTLSEFSGPSAFREFCLQHGLPPNRDLNHVAALGENPAADAFFTAELEMVKRTWARDALRPARDALRPVRDTLRTKGSQAAAPQAPDYLILGHDELGFDSVCFIKAGKTRGNPQSRSALVAAEINRRVSQVDAILGKSVIIILYGDSFLPTDLGERYGLAGDPVTGKDGVLWLLKNKYALSGRILISPWNYILIDGDEHYWSHYKYDKEKQFALLERLGFGFIPGIGEAGSAGDVKANRMAPPFALGMRDKTMACLLEWVAAARRHPRLLRGYADQLFEPYDLCTPDSLCAGFTAPMLAYAAWLYPEGPVGPVGPVDPESRAVGHASSAPLPPADLLKQVDYRRSRKEGKWDPGVHYPKP